MYNNEYLCAKQQNTSVNEVTHGINSISKAFGDAALIFKKTYDQIDPGAVNANNTIIDSNAKTKLLEEKLQAVIDSVKQWLTTDSNTKKEALQALQRNTEVIGKEVEKAKRQLDDANKSASKASGADKSKFNNEIQANANAVSANSQYYMATKTRFDYETKYKEMIDERNRRLDMVKKIDDPNTIRELLSDSSNISGKKYGEQMGTFTNADVKMGKNLSQEQQVNQGMQNTNVNNIGATNAYTQNDAPVKSISLNSVNNNGQSVAQNIIAQPNNDSPHVWHSVSQVPSLLQIPSLQMPNATQVSDLPQMKQQPGTQLTPILRENSGTQQIKQSTQQNTTQNLLPTPKQQSVGKQQIKYTESKTIGVSGDDGKVEETTDVPQNPVITQPIVNVSQQKQLLTTPNNTKSSIPQLPPNPSTISISQQVNTHKILSPSQPGIVQNTSSPLGNTTTSNKTAKKLSKVEIARLLAPLETDKK